MGAGPFIICPYSYWTGVMDFPVNLVNNSNEIHFELFIKLSWDKIHRHKAFKHTWALSNPDVRQDKERWHVDGPLRSEKRRVMEESSDDCFSDSRYNETRELGALWAFQGTSHNKQINNRKNISAKTNDINIIFYCLAIDFVTAWVTSEHTINWQQEMDEKQLSAEN